MTATRSTDIMTVVLYLTTTMVPQEWTTVDITSSTSLILADRSDRTYLVSDYFYRSGFRDAYRGVGRNIYSLATNVPRHVAIVSGDRDSYQPGSQLRTAFRHDSGLVFCFYNLSDIPSYTDVITFRDGCDTPRTLCSDILLEVIRRNGTGIGHDIRDGHYSSPHMRYNFFPGLADSVDITGCPDDSLQFDVGGEPVSSTSISPYDAIIAQQPSSSLRLVSTDMGAKWTHPPVPTSSSMTAMLQ